ncbi:MAG: cell division protein ZipA C-terminal FtsZ-binding domain-containing protein [Rhodocyclaceae bacterium]|jgi:FtsZ-interacting cell division protein ZipA|nr:cell division protein ZipA C-terminal FtsZ-binding domain-containing protein [Rhodocyclaceae bacterium]MBK6907164.1 cell division protein ZipA C-terminal FtsZ-binding domain-containing protein [Rhodocyclaceae bacterium]
MNELQLALLGAGVVAVIAVWIYNAVQERKHRKLAEAIFKGAQDDVLISEPPGAIVAQRLTNEQDFTGQSEAPAEHREPAIPVKQYAPEANPPPASAIQDAEAQAPQQEALPGPEDMPTGRETPLRNETGPDDLLPWADPLADCLISFVVPAPISAAAVWAAQSPWLDSLSKPVSWLARVDERSPWVHVGATSVERFGQWLAAVQMVNRAGAISDGDLGRFSDGVQRIAQQCGGTLELPSRSAMLMRAQDLDRFCASVDVQFSINIVSAQGGAFAGTKLRGVCEAAGLTLESDGLYHYRNASGESEFTLGNLGNERFDATAISSLATHGVTLSIDVPRVSDGAAAFNRLILVARQLAQGLGGIVVDSNRAALAEPMIAAIRGKIGELQQVLGKAGIAPGSARALRLFS